MLVLTVLLAASLVIAAQPSQPASAETGSELSEQQKAKVLREVAQNWMQVGVEQYKRGLYEQAKNSFLTAKGFEEYLTFEEQKQLEAHLENTRRADAEKQAVLEQIKIANDLLEQGQPIKARAIYEKVRNSPYITEQQRRQIVREIQKVDTNFDKKMKEVTALYNRSVELYRAGELEKAREGFADVARYGQYVAPGGMSAEDYLIQIDSVLTGQLRPNAPTEKKEIEKSVIAPKVETILPVEPPVLSYQTNELPVKINEQAEENAREQAAEVKEAAEPTPTQAELALEAKKKIVRTYTKAVVDNTANQVQLYIAQRDFDKAIEAVRKATDIVRDNRSVIGDELFTQHSIQLKELVGKIIEAQKAS
jgi:tetratricopeptide (TPR) repeat protein